MIESPILDRRVPGWRELPPAPDRRRVPRSVRGLRPILHAGHDHGAPVVEARCPSCSRRVPVIDRTDHQPIRCARCVLEAVPGA